MFGGNAGKFTLEIEKVIRQGPLYGFHAETSAIIFHLNEGIGSVKSHGILLR
jgi:hypothetical protein